MTFQLVCEIEPPTKPDLTRVRHQIGVLSPVASSFLIPDNHIGRATVSSIAVAHEVAAMGGRSIACLNSRDRNLLGFRRDLLTAAAYGPASPRMARELAASIPDIDIPGSLVDRVAQDRDAGVEAACEMIDQIRDSGAFDGVHLVPVSRYRQVALRLEHRLSNVDGAGPRP